MSDFAGAAGFHTVPAAATIRANRSWWDQEAPDYLAEHGEFLGHDRFIWCPEGLDEAEARLLGPVVGRRVLEVGAGAAQCSRWLSTQGAQPVAIDLSVAMLRQGRAANAPIDPWPTPTGADQARLIQADACRLPFADNSFDLACSAYGAVPFVAEPALIMAEVARVLRPGGRWVCSVTHPLRWALPDEPGPEGLTVSHSYFDRTPYVEVDDAGRLTYAEHHRTLQDRVADLVGAGFRITQLVEPTWPEGHEQPWGGWSPLRGRLIPGTLIMCAELDQARPST
jgi:SAM-dependent methyltransferase